MKLLTLDCGGVCGEGDVYVIIEMKLRNIKILFLLLLMILAHYHQRKAWLSMGSTQRHPVRRAGMGTLLESLGGSVPGLFRLQKPPGPLSAGSAWMRLLVTGKQWALLSPWERCDHHRQQLQAQSPETSETTPGAGYCAQPHTLDPLSEVP